MEHVAPSLDRLASSATVGAVALVRAALPVMAAAVAIVLVACSTEAPPADGEIRLSGSIYTDFIVDTPCDEQQAPVELTGVELAFRDPAGKLLATAVTGPPTHRELPKGPGTETWAHGGCRMLAPYAVILPAAERYSVEFKPRDVPRPIGRPYFQGVDMLEPQSATMADLASRGFTWHFEAPAAFVAS
jgi:hypothetical protein